MPTFTELLPATLSSKHAGIRWTPDAHAARGTVGTLVIQNERDHAEYRVEEFRAEWRGRAFRLTKTAGGTDAEAEGYDVFVSDAGPAGHICECRGFLRWRRNCKHIEAVLALAANGWLAGQTPTGTAFGCRKVEPAAGPATAAEEPTEELASDLPVPAVATPAPARVPTAVAAWIAPPTSRRAPPTSTTSDRPVPRRGPAVRPGWPVSPTLFAFLPRTLSEPTMRTLDRAARALAYYLAFLLVAALITRLAYHRAGRRGLYLGAAYTAAGSAEVLAHVARRFRRPARRPSRPVPGSPTRSRSCSCPAPSTVARGRLPAPFGGPTMTPLTRPADRPAARRGRRPRRPAADPVARARKHFPIWYAHTTGVILRHLDDCADLAAEMADPDSPLQDVFEGSELRELRDILGEVDIGLKNLNPRLPPPGDFPDPLAGVRPVRRGR